MWLILVSRGLAPVLVLREPCFVLGLTAGLLWGLGLLKASFGMLVQYLVFYGVFFAVQDDPRISL
jgi:hypothetical protein